MDLRFLKSMAIASLLVFALAGCSLFVRVADEDHSGRVRASIQRSSQNSIQDNQLAQRD